MTDFYTLPPSAKEYFHEKELHARAFLNKVMQRMNNYDYHNVPAFRADQCLENAPSDLAQGSHRLTQRDAETIYKNWRETALHEFETWKDNAHHLFYEGDYRHPAETWKHKADATYNDWMHSMTLLANEQFHDYNLQWDPVLGWNDVAEVKVPQSHLIATRTDHRSFQDRMHDAVANSTLANESVDEVLRHKLDLVYGGFHPGRMAHTENADGQAVTKNVEVKHRIDRSSLEDRNRNQTRETNHDAREQLQELKRTDIRVKPPIEQGQMRDRVREMEVYAERFEI